MPAELVEKMTDRLLAGCEICYNQRTDQTFLVDWMVPLFLGGEAALSNVMVSCYSCAYGRTISFMSRVELLNRVMDARRNNRADEYLEQVEGFPKYDVFFRQSLALSLAFNASNHVPTIPRFVHPLLTYWDKVERRDRLPAHAHDTAIQAYWEMARALSRYDRVTLPASIIQQQVEHITELREVVQELFLSERNDRVKELFDEALTGIDETLESIEKWLADIEEDNYP